MKIAVDARELCGRPTGVGRYLSRLLATWDGLPAAASLDLVLYAPPSIDTSLASRATARLRTQVRVLAGAGGTWWEQVTLAAALRRDRPDVLFAPAYSAPLNIRTPVVLTVHDVSFLAHPEWFPPRTRLRQRLLTSAAARRARTVITDSEFSRREISRLIGIPPDRITVIPLGLALPAGGGRASDRPWDPLVLFVGSIFNRRHLPETIRAVAAVAQRHPEVRLEVVGDNRTYPRQDLEAVARDAGIADRVTLRSYVTDEDLAMLYGSAGAFVFLSDYEGFGLTPLEALASGIPVVVGDTPVAREVCGDAARYVRTTDVNGVASALETVLYDRAARKALLSQAAAVLSRYSWERAGSATLEAVLGAVGARR